MKNNHRRNRIEPLTVLLITFIVGMLLVSGCADATKSGGITSTPTSATDTFAVKTSTPVSPPTVTETSTITTISPYVTQSPGAEPVSTPAVTVTEAPAAVQSDNEYFELMAATSHFLIYFHPQDEEFAPALVLGLEEQYSLLVETYGGELTDKTKIFLYADLEEAVRLGFCTGAPVQPDPGLVTGEFTLTEPLGEGVKVFVPEEYKDRSPNHESFMKFLLMHEVGHRFFYHLYPDVRYPIRPHWLDEGLAMYVGIESSQQLFHLEPVLQSIQQESPSFVALGDLDRLQESGESPGLFYGEAATIIYFLDTSYHDGALQQFLAEYQRTVDINQAFHGVLDISCDGFAHSWEEYIRNIAVQSADAQEFYRLLTEK